ncbi:MAG: HAD family phosphatase [SAR324 cluster bacterium]|nr:HAD family phosphatase [SAR324 cluster bacterium]
MVDTVVFDLGGVLIDWNPKHLYQKIFNQDSEKIEYFLSHVCTLAWNSEQDAGRPFQEGRTLLKRQYPEYAEAIDAYDFLWEEMLGGVDEEVADILFALKKEKIPVYALTNWSKEKFPIARKRYKVLDLFEGIFVSGEVGCRKPSLTFYQLFLEKYEIEAQRSVFIDDVQENVEGAEKAGMHAIRFQNAQQLTQDLKKLGIEY